MCIMWTWKSEEGVGLPGTKVTNGYKLQCRCWGLNAGLLPTVISASNQSHLSSIFIFVHLYIQS